MWQCFVCESSNKTTRAVERVCVCVLVCTKGIKKRRKLAQKKKTDNKGYPWSKSHKEGTRSRQAEEKTKLRKVGGKFPLPFRPHHRCRVSSFRATASPVINQFVICLPTKTHSPIAREHGPRVVGFRSGGAGGDQSQQRGRLDLLRVK